MNYKVVCVSLLLVPLAGCSIFQPSAPAAAPAPAPQTQSEKFTESKSQAPTAVESALLWSDKYTRLSDEMTQQKARSQILQDENTKFQQKTTQLQSQLDQAQKELTEANNLLIDMRKELNNWKSDVLSYRDEMRTAQKAQLEALNRVLNILGGEMTPSVPDANSAETNNEPNK